MDRSRRLTVGTRLTLAIALMIAFIGAIGYSGFHGSRTTHTQLSEIFAVRLPSLDLLLEADRDLQQLLAAERTLLFTPLREKAFDEQIDEGIRAGDGVHRQAAA